MGGDIPKPHGSFVVAGGYCERFAVWAERHRIKSSGALSERVADLPVGAHVPQQHCPAGASSGQNSAIRAECHRSGAAQESVPDLAVGGYSPQPRAP